MFGKNEDFGARNTFASPEFRVGNHQFGHRNWGLEPKDLPANDVNAWDARWQIPRLHPRARCSRARAYFAPSSREQGAESDKESSGPYPSVCVFWTTHLEQEQTDTSQTGFKKSLRHIRRVEIDKFGLSSVSNVTPTMYARAHTHGP